MQFEKVFWHNRGLLSAVVLAGSLSLGACASGEPTFGEIVSGQGSDLQDIGTLWEEGRKMAQRGDKLLSQGRRESDKGREKLRKGERQVQEGNRLVQSSRADYVSRSRIAGTATNPEQVQGEARTLQSISDDWDKGLEIVDEGTDLVKDGDRLISSGRKNMDEGQSLSFRGQEMMKTSEETYARRNPVQ